MPNIGTGAERTPHDLSHFCYNTGALGRLKTLSFTNVLPGDSIELDLVGSFRLSPLLRGLTVDASCDVFTFYMPYRFVYGDDWEKFLRNGIKGGTDLPFDSAPSASDSGTAWSANLGYLGIRNTPTLNVPKWLHSTYLAIFNNYFKYPSDPDVAKTIKDLSHQERDDGFACAYLKTMWSAPLPDDTKTSHDMETGSASLDLFALNKATANLFTEQERDLFMVRYRDIIESFGGHASIEVDKRPKLLMRTNFWASGYDVDGTGQAVMGQFSGRTQQTFRHQVPRFFCPEHGVIFTLFLSRFPTIHEYEREYLAGIASPDYQTIAGDPTITSNYPAQEVPINSLFCNTSNDGVKLKLAHGQWYRYHSSYVDQRYNNVKGFPFYYKIPTTSADVRYINPSDFDPMFQTTQLGHWNLQAKFNETVYRRLPNARDSLMIS